MAVSIGEHPTRVDGAAMSDFDILTIGAYADTKGLSMSAMNVSLTPELDRFVREAVGAGRYQSSSEVVREALRLLQDRLRRDALTLEVLRAEIKAGIDSGPASPLDLAGIKAQARARFDAERQGTTEN